MAHAWLLLVLATQVHLMALSGYGFKQPIAALLLLPLVAPFGFGLLKRRNRLPLSGLPVRLAGLVAFHAALLLMRRGLLQPFDPKDPWMAGLVTLVGVLAAYVAVAREEGPVGCGGALWIGAWMGLGWVDPLLPLLGGGVTALLAVFNRWPEPAPREAPAKPLSLGWTWFLLGLVLPKPWWDFGLNPASALALATFGLGWALAPLLARALAFLPGKALLGLVAALFVLYHPALLAPWGLLLGLLWGTAEARTAPAPLSPRAHALLVGLALSFLLHANAWLPGLRHLLWLGN